MRGDYDYNHASSGHQFVVITVLVIVSMMVLGGLFIGLNILDHF